MSEETYSKTLRHLTITEICTYGLAKDIIGLDIKDRLKDAIAKILNKEPTFLDDESKIFYFKKSRNGRKYELISNPKNVASFPLKIMSEDQRINIEELKNNFDELKSNDGLELDEDIKAENEENVPETRQAGKIDQTLDVNTIQALLTALNSKTGSTSNKSLNFRPKLKYEPTHGIEAFIKSVECYGEANDIIDKKKWIAIAKTALNASEDGLLLQDALLPAEEEDWDLFKNRLLSILGNPPDYYRDVYRSFRRGTQKPGLAMSKLTQAYKRGFLNNGQSLTDSDKQHIMHQFINSLDNPLRGLVKAEEKTLTFGKCADRVAELERCFGSGFAPQSAASLMFPEARVQMVRAENAEQTQNTVQLKMIELMNSMIEQSKNQHAEMMKNIHTAKTQNRSNQNRNNRSKFNLGEITKKLDGHCYFWLKNGDCRKKNNCTYKHSSDVPAHIKKLVK